MNSTTKHIGNLSPAPGSRHKKKRIGRGQGSGHGGTSTRGHKGHQSRSGFSQSPGFEGGQMSLKRRVPKFGFTNIAFANEFQIINLSDLHKVEGVVDAASLYEAGLITKKARVKVLGKGELTKAFTVKAHAFSAKAKEAIEKAGGKTEVIK